MYCKKCGTKLTDGERFCHKCGAEVEDNTEQNISQNRETVTPGQEPVTSDEEAPKKRLSMAQIAGIVCVAVVVVVAVIAISLSFGGTEEDSAEETVLSPEMGNDKVDVEENIEDNAVEEGLPTTIEATTEVPGENWAIETEKTYKNGELVSSQEYDYNEEHTSYKRTDYDAEGIETGWEEGTVDEDGNFRKLKAEGPPYSDSNMRLYEEYNYDNDPATYQEVCYNEDGSVAYEGEGIINENGDLLPQKETKDYREYGFYNNTYTYDENQKPMSGTCYDELNDFEWNIEFTYDANGYETAQLWYDSDGNITIGTEWYSYDENGNLILQGYFGGSDGGIELREYTYDNNGNMLSEKIYFGYWEYGKEWSETEFEENNFESWNKYNYDENNNLLSMTKYDESGNSIGQTEYTYTYNANGNLQTYTECDANGNITYAEEYTYISY